MVSRPHFIESGQLRWRLLLQKFVEDHSICEKKQGKWKSIAWIFCYLEPTNPTPVFAGDQHMQRLERRISCRYRPDIETGMRLTGNGRIFKIVALYDEDGSKKILSFLTQEEEEKG